ncbi:tRNA (guanosine(37)-N1)-methyltransferase TrmD [Desulfovibrio sp. OttesenSCG-928-I05]|nr:tRNA (guanosine(37)-N1)-methyltransferase TrmD [Desulfovibrio sp. OttesenSCG-928-I05]
MRINIITLFPEFFRSPLEAGLLGRALEAGILEIGLHNPRDFSTDKHRSVDDRPYGGGPGMVMLPDPMARTLDSLGVPRGRAGTRGKGRCIMLSPKGRPLTQALARELALEPSLTLICGRYEGPDARLEELYPIESVSLGDFVLNGGEIAALALVEATGRLLPGFMGHEESGDEESFSASLLEYPHYTRPDVFEGLEVPEILRSGDHGRIKAWRREESLKATLLGRPDILPGAQLEGKDFEFLRSVPRALLGKNLYCALVHYPVLDRDGKSGAVSLTNLDIHDIARAARSYNLGGYFIVTPLKDQSRLLETLLGHWTDGAGGEGNPDRKEALRHVRHAALVDDAIRAIEERTGQVPLLLGSSASSNAPGAQCLPVTELREKLRERPALLLFGTGQGLAPEILERCDGILPPIRPLADYNHFSVRSAASILLDRILGDWY